MRYIYRNHQCSSPIIEKDVDFVATQLLAGKVIAFPTDTVFGLGCIADNETAIQKMKVIKGRLESKPFPMMSADSKLKGIAKVDQLAQKLFDRFSPGNITLILEKDEQVPAFVTNGASTIAIRIPDDAFVLAVIRKVGKPLLVTSANKSDYPTCQTVDEVLDQLFNQIDYIVEGESGSHTASTIVDVKNKTIIREGTISKHEIEQIIKQTT